MQVNQFLKHKCSPSQVTYIRLFSEDTFEIPFNDYHNSLIQRQHKLPPCREEPPLSQLSDLWSLPAFLDNILSPSVVRAKIKASYPSPQEGDLTTGQVEAITNFTCNPSLWEERPTDSASGGELIQQQQVRIPTLTEVISTSYAKDSASRKVMLNTTKKGIHTVQLIEKDKEDESHDVDSVPVLAEDSSDLQIRTESSDLLYMVEDIQRMKTMHVETRYAIEILAHRCPQLVDPQDSKLSAENASSTATTFSLNSPQYSSPTTPVATRVCLAYLVKWARDILPPRPSDACYICEPLSPGGEKHSESDGDVAKPKTKQKIQCGLCGISGHSNCAFKHGWRRSPLSRAEPFFCARHYCAVCAQEEHPARATYSCQACTLSFCSTHVPANAVLVQAESHIGKWSCTSLPHWARPITCGKVACTVRYEKEESNAYKSVAEECSMAVAAMSGGRARDFDILVFLPSDLRETVTFLREQYLLTPQILPIADALTTVPLMAAIDKKKEMKEMKMFGMDDQNASDSCAAFYFRGLYCLHFFSVDVIFNLIEMLGAHPGQSSSFTRRSHVLLPNGSHVSRNLVDVRDKPALLDHLVRFLMCPRAGKMLWCDQVDRDRESIEAPSVEERDGGAETGVRRREAAGGMPNERWMTQ